MQDSKSEDHAAIKEIVELYIAGGKSGNPEVMSDAFHKDATIYGWIYSKTEESIENIEVAGPIQLLYDFVNEIGPADQLKADFVRIDIVGTSANVKLELYNWKGIRFTDTLNLIKKDNRWRIVNKIFDQIV